MNEATTFANGEMAYPGPTPKEESKSRFLNAKLKAGVKVDWYGSSPNQDTLSTYNLPFIPGIKNQPNLDVMSLSLNATHYNN